MTSKKFMLMVVLALQWPAMGCSKSDVVVPDEYESPYPGTKLWAVAPFRNESGTTLVNGIDFAERLTHRLERVPRIRTVPVNRVLAAMDRLQIVSIDEPAKVNALLHTLGVDGLIVGTVTAWDPYEPPKIGSALQLYANRGTMVTAQTDPRAVRAASTAGSAFSMGAGADPLRPVAEASGYFDANNGVVLKRLEQYAHGRAQKDSAAGPRRFLVSMDLYSEFVSHELMRMLFAREWERLHSATQRGATSDRGPNEDLSGPPQRDALRELGIRELGIF